MEQIPKGAFQVARKIFESELWLKKPCSWKVIWIYILGKVNHADNNLFERGENYFNFTEERRLIGSDVTEDMIKKFLQYSRRNEMIDTKRSTRGMIIKVLKYNTYQTLENYTSTNQSTREAREKHERSTPINKNDKNIKNDKKLLVEQNIELNELLIKYIPVRDITNKSNQTYIKRLFNHYEKDLTKIEALCKAVEYFSKSEYPYSIYSIKSLYEKIDKIEARTLQERNKINSKKNKITKI